VSSEKSPGSTVIEASMCLIRQLGTSKRPGDNGPED